MDFEQLKELIEQINSSNLRVFELENEVVSIKMSKNDSSLTVKEQAKEVKEQDVRSINASQKTAPVKESTNEAAEHEKTLENVHEVTAPIVGTAYLASSPDSAPFVKIGDSVKKGEPLVIVEAMKVMNEIKSDVDGEIIDVLVEDGQPIEFGQVLVQIKLN